MATRAKTKDGRKPTVAINYWSEASGGVRGSLLLKLGALTLLAAAFLNAAGTLAGYVQPESGVLALKLAWLVWIAALWVVGAGFVWIGLNPVLSRIGLAPGLLHIFQGLFLLLALFGDFRLPIPNTALSSGRLLLIILFAAAERDHLPGRQVKFLAGAAALIQIKLLLRVITPLRDMPELWQTMADVVLLSLLGGALLAVTRTIRQREDGWARDQYMARAAGFSAFNNPQHPWNQE